MKLSYLIKYFDAFRRVEDDDVDEGSTHREHKQQQQQPSSVSSSVRRPGIIDFLPLRKFLFSLPPLLFFQAKKC